MRGSTATRAAEKSLQQCLQQAQQALQELTIRRQGKPRLTERAAVEEAINEIFTHFRAEGLLRVDVREQVQEHPVRAYRGRLSAMRRDLTFTISSERKEDAIAQAISQLGWRAYAPKHSTEPLTLEQAVEAYRDE